MWIITQKTKAGHKHYFSSFLFPHWEGQLCLGITKFKTKRKAERIARQIGGKVEEWIEPTTETDFDEYQKGGKA